MTSPQFNTSDSFFGSSLLEDDLFAFGTSLIPTPNNNTSPTIHKHSPSTPAIDYSSFDFSQCLVSQIIDNADPSVVSLFDAESSLMFSSLFPDAAPPAAAASAPTASLDAAQAAQLLASTEAALAGNPGLAPAVARLRQSLVAAQTMVSPALTSLSSLSPASAALATPFLGFDAALDFSPQSQPASSPLLDAFAVPWALPANSASAAATSAPPPDEKPKSKAGRKRKERPNDPVQLLQELDLKRQRNTESARRSRVKRMAELDMLHQDLANAREGEKTALEQVKALQAELDKAKKLLAIAGERLKAVAA